MGPTLLAIPPRKRYQIYVDESSQTGCRYMVLGALVVEEGQAATLDARLERFKHDNRLDRELKWGKVSRSMLENYAGYVSTVLEALKRDAPGYYCIVIDTSELDHARFNSGSSEIGFSKFVYQLLMKCARLFHMGSNLDCFLDDRVTRQTLQELRNILNNGADKTLRARPFRRVEYRDSKASNLIQAVDLLTGAVAYHWNGRHHMQDASPARVWLAEEVARKIGMGQGLNRATGAGRQRFSIWKFAAQPSKRASGRA